MDVDDLPLADNGMFLSLTLNRREPIQRPLGIPEGDTLHAVTVSSETFSGIHANDREPITISGL